MLAMGVIRKVLGGPLLRSVLLPASQVPRPNANNTFLHYRTSKVRVLRAAQLERLVWELVSVDREQDPSFVPAFLATHRAFVPTARVLGLLLPPPPPPMPPWSVGMAKPPSSHPRPSPGPSLIFRIRKSPKFRTLFLSPPLPCLLSSPDWGAPSRVEMKKTEGQDLSFNKNLRLVSSGVAAGGPRDQRSDLRLGVGGCRTPREPLRPCCSD